MDLISHTIIGVFDMEFDAIAAVDELLNHGFTRHNIHISDRSNTNRSFLSHEDDDHEIRVSRFFKMLFSENINEADKYTKVALETAAVVVVYGHSAEEANKAAEILDNNRAINVDQWAAEMEEGNMPSDIDMEKKVAENRPQTSSEYNSRIIEWSTEESKMISEERLNESKIW